MTEDELLRQLRASEDEAEAYVEELGQFRMASAREYSASRIRAMKSWRDGRALSPPKSRTRLNGCSLSC